MFLALNPIRVFFLITLFFIVKILIPHNTIAAEDNLYQVKDNSIECLPFDDTRGVFLAGETPRKIQGAIQFEVIKKTKTGYVIRMNGEDSNFWISAYVFEHYITPSSEQEERQKIKAAEQAVSLQEEITVKTEAPKLFCQDLTQTQPFKANGALSTYHHQKTGHDEKIIKWDECGEGSFVSGNYGDYNCSKNREISSEFLQFLNTNFSQCTASAVQASGVDMLPIQHLHINHDGIFGDDRHQNKPIASYHNVYRALDLNAIMITRQDGTKMEFNYEKGAAAIILAEERGIELTEEEKKEFNFWKKFRTCWTQQIQLYFKEHAPDSNCRTQSGTVGWENEDHKHHLHLSLPFCPPKRGFRRS